MENRHAIEKANVLRKYGMDADKSGLVDILQYKSGVLPTSFSTLFGLYVSTTDN